MNVQDTLTDIVNSTNRVWSEKAKTRKGESMMDQDAFLQLLMQQIKHQDPLNPMSNSEFVSQQAQFTTISELQKLNNTMGASNQIMQASMLIGREVTLTNPNNPEDTVKGTVTEAKISSKGSGIVVNDELYPIELVTNIK